MRGSATHSGMRCLLMLVPILCSFIPGSLLTADDERNLRFASVTLCWFLSCFLPNVFSLIGICSGCHTNSNTVPLDIGKMVHRYGEWMILCLGAGVFLLIVSVENRSAFAQSCLANGYQLSEFCISMIVLIAILHVYTYVERFEPEFHALRRSRLSGMTWIILTPLLSCAVVAAGATLNQILVEETHTQVVGCSQDKKLRALAESDAVFTPANNPDAYYWTLAVSCSSIMLIIWLLDLNHTGSCEWRSLIRNSNTIAERVAVYLLKFLLAASFFALPFMSSIPSQARLFLTVVALGLGIPLQYWHASSRCPIGYQNESETTDETESPEIPKQSNDTAIAIQ
mmetsp:Transcript_4641/g.6193  ORF Transcript_4641/g.6193 Transcript_4641/m.6193 type:complete len:341 (-) Transcript_4641:430-1452(-)